MLILKTLSLFTDTPTLADVYEGPLGGLGSLGGCGGKFGGGFCLVKSYGVKRVGSVISILVFPLQQSRLTKLISYFEFGGGFCGGSCRCVVKSNGVYNSFIVILFSPLQRSQLN